MTSLTISREPSEIPRHRLERQAGNAAFGICKFKPRKIDGDSPRLPCSLLTRGEQFLNADAGVAFQRRIVLSFLAAHFERVSPILSCSTLEDLWWGKDCAGRREAGSARFARGSQRARRAKVTSVRSDLFADPGKRSLSVPSRISNRFTAPLEAAPQPIAGPITKIPNACANYASARPLSFSPITRRIPSGYVAGELPRLSVRGR